MASPFEYIPSEWHLISLFLTALAGFFVIIGFPSAEIPQDKPKGIAYLMKIKRETKEEDFDNFDNEVKEELHEEHQEQYQEERQYEVKFNLEKKEEEKVDLAPMTPRRTPKKRYNSRNSSPSTPTSITVGENDFGSVVTPLGRRSARVAKRSAHKSPNPNIVR